jgi:hypothetical protein
MRPTVNALLAALMFMSFCLAMPRKAERVAGRLVLRCLR